MRRMLVLALLLLPLTALAASPCTYSSPRTLKLDLAGIHGVRVDVGSQNVHVHGSGNVTGLQLDGRACASDKASLDKLRVTSRRDGDQLIIEVGQRSGWFNMSLFGSSYAYLDVNLQLPASMPVTLEVGSGDADATGLQQLVGHVGSGDLHVHDLAGTLTASVGSGDIVADHIGGLDMHAVGSGDVKVRDVRGEASVGSLGSGDVKLEEIGGSVHVGSLGSGDLTVRDVQGDLSLDTRGSGDVDYSGIKGKTSVPRGDD
ncbi:DUF4097 family beta strand repeat-containing protein [Dyella sp. A6]|uniref:DUF4097 family beta strand repeat-containing protein n=1 Tax=Dyella aluminiiresistens TaxID=3069105 RepID=UPI002E78C1FD|nr:DUF4097 family beta strand repeat-containing protein [Dyella sp. A6]